MDKRTERLGVLSIPIHTFRMDITASFYKAAKVPPRRYGDKFTNPKFPPRIRSNRRFKSLEGIFPAACGVNYSRERVHS